MLFLKRNAFGHLASLLRPIYRHRNSVALSAVLTPEESGFIKLFVHAVDNDFNFGKHLLAVLEVNQDESKTATALDLLLADYFPFMTEDKITIHITYDTSNKVLTKVFDQAICSPVTLSCMASKLQRLVQSVAKDNPVAFSILEKVKAFLTALAHQPALIVALEKEAQEGNELGVYFSI